MRYLDQIACFLVVSSKMANVLLLIAAVVMDYIRIRRKLEKRASKKKTAYLRTISACLGIRTHPASLPVITIRIIKHYRGAKFS
jgi:hypothetical protein